MSQAVQAKPCLVQRKAAVILASSDGSLTRCQVLEHAGTTVNNTDKRGSLAVEKGLSFRDVLTGGSQTTWAPTTRLATSTLASMSPAITPQAPTSAPTATRLPPSNEWLRLLLYMTPPHRGYCRPVVHTHWYLQDSLLFNLIAGERQLQTCTFEVLFAQGWPLFKISSHWACRWFLRQTSCSGWCMHQHWLSLSARPPERSR
ncbi:uncharacterized protein LOC119178420 isoform X2 [Rhipicephalus microplus]|uniref:uncharacterized protein LOC119178420 isoform X2 n=1 Tax=Rhipicephalus microplus TaxID=6941 RepID=UPI003F6A6FEF